MNTYFVYLNIYFLMVLLISAVFSGLWFRRKPNWMGFKGKTLWDWVEMLTVPSLIGLATVLLSASQAEIESARQQEIAVQQYIDRISDLSLDERATAHPEQSLAIGRAQTTAILQTINKERTGRVLRFCRKWTCYKNMQLIWSF